MRREEDDRKVPEQLCVEMKGKNPFLLGPKALPIRCVLSRFSHVQLFATLCTIACQALLSMGFSRQEHWSGLPCPPPGDPPAPGIEPTSLPSPALAGGLLTSSATWEASLYCGGLLTHPG